MSTRDDVVSRRAHALSHDLGAGVREISSMSAGSPKICSACVSPRASSPHRSRRDAASRRRRGAKFDHRAEQRVDLDRAAGFDILQHRGLCSPMPRRRRCACRGKGETGCPRSPPRLRLAHHRRRKRAGRREPQMSSRVAWLSALTGLKSDCPRVSSRSRCARRRRPAI